MATIYRAWDTTLERDVAVKVIHEHLADDADTRERFRREAHHAAALVHPHIVTVFDQGTDALPNGASGTPRPYMVMELIDGPSLREVLQQQGRLTPAEMPGTRVREPVARESSFGAPTRSGNFAPSGGAKFPDAAVHARRVRGESPAGQENP